MPCSSCDAKLAQKKYLREAIASLEKMYLLIDVSLSRKCAECNESDSEEEQDLCESTLRANEEETKGKQEQDSCGSTHHAARNDRNNKVEGDLDQEDSYGDLEQEDLCGIMLDTGIMFDASDELEAKKVVESQRGTATHHSSVLQIMAKQQSAFWLREFGEALKSNDVNERYLSVEVIAGLVSPAPFPKDWKLGFYEARGPKTNQVQLFWQVPKLAHMEKEIGDALEEVKGKEGKADQCFIVAQSFCFLPSGGAILEGVLPGTWRPVTVQFRATKTTCLAHMRLAVSKKHIRATFIMNPIHDADWYDHADLVNQISVS